MHYRPPVPDPSPEEIRREAERIQASWSIQERAKRASGHKGALVIPGGETTLPACELSEDEREVAE